MTSGTITRTRRSRTTTRPTTSPTPTQGARTVTAPSSPRRPPAGAGRPRGPRPPSLAAGLLIATHDALARALQRAKCSRRLFTLLLIYVLLTLLMGWRLVTVQIVAAEDYSELARRQTQREVDLPATRGALTDREGDPLAMSLSAATIFANPRLLAENDIDPYVLASRLSEPLGRSVVDLVEDLTADREFVFLGRQLPRAVGEEITAMELAGIGVLEEPNRVYPADRIASQVVGWAGVDNSGLAGIELQYDEALAGVAGTLRLERAPGGLEITAAPREVVPATAGADIRLTIDREVQFATEEILVEAVETYDAIGGSAVVLDPRTGEILAMASVPSVAPTAFADSEPYARRNRAVTDVFEPGSVNKVITIAGAIEDGVIGADQSFEVADRIAIGPEVFNDSSGHATSWWSVNDIIARSSNVGTIKIAQALGEERLYHYVTEFGLGRPTGLGFPGESNGLLAEVDDWSISSLPTIAIGQGVSATLVQVAQAFGVIANDGTYVPPSLVQGTVGADGVFTPAATAEPRQVVSAETAETVAQMLVDVVESDVGTGSRAAVRGYSVGGKTGTAQKPLEGARGYREDAWIATFAGFAPVEDPQVVVAVMLDEPTPHYGGLSAAPTFSRIMEFALRDQRIPPHTPQIPLPVGQRLGNTFATAPTPTETASDTASDHEITEESPEAESSGGDDGAEG